VVSIRDEGGPTLQALAWQSSAPRARLVIVHGLGEHAGCYQDLAEWVGRALEIDVLAVSLRGHGGSQGRRGYAASLDALADDVRSALRATARPSDLPTYLLGHSMGGLLSLLVGAEAGARVDGLILSNPFLRMRMKPPRLKLMAGQILRRCAPFVTLSGRLPADWLSSDPSEQARRRRDPLVHSRVSAPIYFGMVERGAELLAHPERVIRPSLWIVGGRDPIIDSRATCEFVARLPPEQARLALFESMLHEPFHELGRERAFTEVAVWIDGQLARHSASRC
jgi:alpha-beta hydrolase superfamily lysophospholipase